MKDWEEKLMEKLAEEMRAGKDSICPRDYSEAMGWYSDERLLEIVPRVEIYGLPSGNTTLFNANGNLYIHAEGRFDKLGRTSELLNQVKLPEPQTDDEQRSTKAQGILDGLDWMKSEALKRLNEEVPGLDIDSVDVVSTGHEPFNEDWPTEDGDLVLWIKLDLCLLDVSIEQLDKLTAISDEAVVHRVNIEDTPVTYEVWYTMTYDFTFWDDELKDNFVKHWEE